MTTGGPGTMRPRPAFRLSKDAVLRLKGTVSRTIVVLVVWSACWRVFQAKAPLTLPAGGYLVAAAICSLALTIALVYSRVRATRGMGLPADGKWYAYLLPIVVLLFAAGICCAVIFGAFLFVVSIGIALANELASIGLAQAARNVFELLPTLYIVWAINIYGTARSHGSNATWIGFICACAVLTIVANFISFKIQISAIELGIAAGVYLFVRRARNGTAVT